MTTELTTKDNEMITTRELAEQLGTSIKVVLENARKCLPNKEIRNGKPTYWSKEEVTVVLEQMKENPKTNSSELYVQSKATTSTDMTPALKLKKAMELANEAYQEEIERLKALNIEVLNENGQLKLVAKQAVERAEAAEKRTEEVFEYNRNFHNHLYTATELGKTLGTSSNNIGRIANKLGLKREPEYGKLGKIQLNNGQWVDQFYYNDNAVDKIKVALLMTEGE